MRLGGDREISEALARGDAGALMPVPRRASSEQLRVATAIVRKLNPDCGFVLIDKLEQLDGETLRDFGAWVEQENLQIIATRVTSSGDDCTIIIEDGTVKEPEPQKPAFKAGVF